MSTTGFDTVERKSALTPLAEQPDPEMVPDWTNIGIFATGIALGIVLGAAAALLVAPASGEEIRGRIAKRFHRGDEEKLWDDLQAELERAAHARAGDR